MDHDSFEATCAHDAKTIYNLLADHLPVETLDTLAEMMAKRTETKPSTLAG